MKHVSMKLVSLGLVATLAVSSSGCAVVMAANQPQYKEVELFKPGTTRGQLLGEFGQPISTETKDGLKCDTFSFTQGYKGGSKAARAFAHGVADIFTLGLWEIIGTPVEAIASGDKVGYQACYDKDERVKYTVLLTTYDGKSPKDVNATYVDGAGKSNEYSRSAYAPVKDISAVPFIKENGRSDYQKFLAAPYKKAFAISEDGHYGWRWGGNDPVSGAITTCQQFTSKQCYLYAVDDDVVWMGDATSPVPGQTSTSTTTSESTSKPTGASGNTKAAKNKPGLKPDDINQLNQLKKLLDNGVITQEEFNAKKAIILDRM